MKLNWEAWVYGLFNGTIGGAATAGSAWLGMSGAKAAGVDVPLLNWKALGVIMLSGALTNAFFYLKQSPLPALETITVRTTETTLETTAVKTVSTPTPPSTATTETAITTKL